MLTISHRVNISQVIMSGQKFEVDYKITKTCLDQIFDVNKNATAAANRRR